MILLELFKYDFVCYAYITIFLLSIMCSLLGNFVVLGRMSSLGDAVSHISFGAMSLAVSITAFPTTLALFFVVLSAIILDRFSKIGVLHGESAVSIVSLFAISIGVISSSIVSSDSVDISHYLFGSALLVSKYDLYWVLGLFFAVFVVMVSFYGDFLYIVSNLESGKRSYRLYKEVSGIFFKIVVSLAIFCAARFLGAILVSSLLIVPACISMKIAKSFKKSLILSLVLSVTIGLGGLTLAIILNLPVGATISFLSSIAFILSFISKKNTKICE